MPKIYGVTLRDDQPLGEVEVALFDASGVERERITTAQDGVFQFDVVPGSWKVQWSLDGGDAEEGEIEVPEGEDTELELVL